jgi:hypothetical protein
MELAKKMFNNQWGVSSQPVHDWGDEYYAEDVKTAIQMQPDYETLTEYWAEGLEERKKRDKHMCERQERSLAKRLHKRTA